MKIRVPFTGRARRGRRPSQPMAGRWQTLAALAAGLVSAPAAFAQAPAQADVVPAYARAVIDGSATFDPNVLQAGCATCGGSPLPNIFGAGAGGGCGSAGGCMCSDGDTCNSCACKPGKSSKCLLDCNTPPDCYIGRMLHGIAACICCPDPCYEPRWSTTANSAFFMDTVRPRTYTRFGWDANRHVARPDRAEFIWARSGASGAGRGPANVETNLLYDDLKLYQEAASGGFSAFIESSYRSVWPENNQHHANFGDLAAGTKSLLIDCELLQFTFQFKTYIPAGNARTGLGTGHTSLEPSLLASLKIDNCTYLQSQVAYWIPIGGDRDYMGATWHYHLSLNRSLYKWGAWEFIGTTEGNAWTFTDGAVTDPVPGNPAAGFNTRASGETYVTAGGGLRVVFCESCDLGLATTYAMTDDHFARELYRLEFRKRY